MTSLNAPGAPAASAAAEVSATQPPQAGEYMETTSFYTTLSADVIFTKIEQCIHTSDTFRIFGTTVKDAFRRAYTVQDALKAADNYLFPHEFEASFRVNLWTPGPDTATAGQGKQVLVEFQFRSGNAWTFHKLYKEVIAVLGPHVVGKLRSAVQMSQ